ncbi:MAG: succinate dehydrogenase assembly factor 2 [Gammaproteobacteria bacterium]|nr:succinate dehydrogenase assembly factor 2 [Gammaproteobacteria bacterium]
MISALDEISRLRWRCRRGFLELDLILDRFLETRYGQLSPSQQQDFQRLLETPDNLLLAYINKTEFCPDKNLEYIISIMQ